VGGLVFQDFFIGDGGTSVFGLTPGGTLYSWGGNETGHLGNGTSTSAFSSPTLVVGGLTWRYVQVGHNTGNSVGAAMTLGLTTAGVAYAWGANGSGNLGDGTVTNRSSPVAVVGGLTFVKVSLAYGSAGGLTTCYGLTAAGALYAWGDNTNGQIGDGTTTSRSSPTLVVGGLVFQNFWTVSGNTPSCFGLDMQNQLWGFGSNSNGQLGIGATGNARSSPTLVLGGIAWQGIAGSLPNFAVTFFLSQTGQLYTCGYDNGSGVMGNAFSSVGVSSPVLVTGGLQFKNLFMTSGQAFGSASCYGLTTGGQIYAWGANTNGQLGTGTAGVPSSTPTLMLGGLAGKTQDDTWAYEIPVVPGQTYNINFGPWAVSFGAVSVGQNNVDQLTVSYDQ
jgi:alpha-tubulin suppressor-like RCC1 family protein